MNYAEFNKFIGQNEEWIDYNDPRIYNGDFTDPQFQEWLVAHVQEIKSAEEKTKIPQIQAVIKPVGNEFGVENLTALPKDQYIKAIWSINSLVHFEKTNKSLNYQDDGGNTVNIGAPNIEPVQCAKDSKTKKPGMSPFYRFRPQVKPQIRVVYRWENGTMVIYGFEYRQDEYRICKFLP